MSDTDPTDQPTGADGSGTGTPRRSRRGPQLIALAIIVLVIIALVIALTPRDGGDGDPEPTTTTEDETTTTESTTTTTEATTTTEPEPPERFESDLGWSIQPGAGWESADDDTEDDLVIWLTPSDVAVTVQTIDNEEGHEVTAESVTEGMQEYLEGQFGATDSAETEEVEMDDRWAVQGRAATDDGQVVATIGSPGRVTYIVAIHGETEAVEKGMDDYEEAVASFRYE